MGGGFLRALFWVAAILLFIVFLFVEILGSGSAVPTATKIDAIAKGGSFKHLEDMERDGAALNPDLDPNYMSKRRVPNGPDPIHNRKRGNLGQPPGRA